MFTISQELGKILYVTSFHAKCLQVLISLPLILWQNKFSLNVSQMNENWTRAGSRALSTESALGCPIWVSSWDTYNWRLQRGKIQMGYSSTYLSERLPGHAWFLSMMESSWGRENVIAELHYLLSHHLSLFSPPPVHVKGFSPEEVQISFWVTPGLYWKRCIFTVSHGM